MASRLHTKGGLCSPKVFIATPTYSGKLDARLVHSLVKGLELLEKNGIGYELFTLSYHCHVDDARNEIVTEFRRSDCDSLIFLDADVSFNPECLLRLANHDRDIVAGVYPKRATHDLDFPVLIEEGIEIWSDKDGLVEVLGAPTGFMKIKRQVLEVLSEKNNDRTYYLKSDKKGDLAHSIIFERTYEDNRRFSGDYAFCRLAKKNGFKVFVDPEMKLTHTGEIEFSGTLGDHWKEKFGVALNEKLQNFDRAVELLKLGVPTEQTFFDLFDYWGNHFSVQPELLAACYYMSKNSKGPILEAGSGLTTLVMALANPEIEVHALEHEIIWASKVKNEILRLGIKNAHIHFSDLKLYEDKRYYDVSTVPDVQFSMCLIDGPPRLLGDRNMIFDLLGERIKSAEIIMDDADNELATHRFREWAQGLGRSVDIFGSARLFAVCRSMSTDGFGALKGEVTL